MPDWRNPADYAYTDKLHVHEWAWEFLRRNPDYIEAWERHAQSEAGNPTWDATYRFNINKPADPNIPAPEGVPEWTEWVDSVLELIDEDEYVELYGDGVPENIQFVRFDLGKPIDPQLDLARVSLRISQESTYGKILPTPKPRREQFLAYVRLLDAKKDGASIGEMSRILFGDHADPRRSAKKALRSAEAQSTDGYKSLLLLFR